MSVKYSKWSQNISIFSNFKPPKMYPNSNFWFEKKRSGNPEGETRSLIISAQCLGRISLSRHFLFQTTKMNKTFCLFYGKKLHTGGCLYIVSFFVEVILCWGHSLLRSLFAKVILCWGHSLLRSFFAEVILYW
jgi:hypothetical protein